MSTSSVVYTFKNYNSTSYQEPNKIMSKSNKLKLKFKGLAIKRARSTSDTENFFHSIRNDNTLHTRSRASSLPDVLKGLSNLSRKTYSHEFEGIETYHELRSSVESTRYLRSVSPSSIFEEENEDIKSSNNKDLIMIPPLPHNVDLNETKMSPSASSVSMMPDQRISVCTDHKPFSEDQIDKYAITILNLTSTSNKDLHWDI